MDGMREENEEAGNSEEVSNNSNDVKRKRTTT